MAKVLEGAYKLSSSYSDSSNDEGDYYNSHTVRVLRGIITGVFCFVFICSVIGTIVGIKVRRPLRIVITIFIDLICVMRCVLQLVPWFRKEEEDKLAIEYSLICDLLYLIMALILIIHVTIQERKDEKIKAMVNDESKMSLKRYFNIENDDDTNDDDNMLYNFKRDSDFYCCSNSTIVPFVCIVLLALILLVCTVFDTYGFVTVSLSHIDSVCGFRTLCVGYCVFAFAIACFVLSLIYRNGSNRFALVCLMCFVKGILTLAAFFVTANFVKVTRYERFWVESVYALVSEAIPILGLLIAFLGIDMYNSSKKAQQIDYTSSLFYVEDN